MQVDEGVIRRCLARLYPQPQLISANKSYLSADDQRAYQSSVGVFNWVNI